MTDSRHSHSLPWRVILSGTCALIIGIGLSRFAYTPLVPALIAQGWFDYAQAGYLGAANFIGYLAGATTVAWMARRISTQWLLRASLVAASAAFFACAFPFSFTWYFCWRFVSGATGGVITVLAVSLVVTRVHKSKRGLAGGLAFMGVGVGVLVASLIIPALASFDLRLTWICLGLASSLLVVAGWAGWSHEVRPDALAKAPASEISSRAIWPVRGLVMVYCLMAVGFVPFMVFYADYIARGLGKGVATGSFFWAMFGVGALIGPVLAGRIGDWLGFKRTLLIATAAATAAMGLILVTTNSLVLALVALVIGGLVPGIAPVTVGRVHELVGQDEAAQRLYWSRATAAFALGQAGAGYVFSYLFAHTESHLLLFGIATLILFFALVIDVVIGASNRTPVTSSE